MAPAKGTKRATSAGAAAASPKKKGRVDPAFAGIIATLQGADDLSERCREMLVAFVAPSLSTLKSDRHNVLSLGVKMIEEMLESHKGKLVTAVDLAQKELACLEGSKSSLIQSLEDARARLEEKKLIFVSATNALEETRAALKVAHTALADVNASQKKGDESHAALEKEKAAIEAAYQEHLKAPMDANETPHYDSLKSFIAHLGLEDSLSSALPASCAKAKDQRGSFDELVLGELGKAMVAKIAALEKSVADGAAGASERQAAVTSAAAALEANELALQRDTAALEAASTAQHEAEVIAEKAAEDWATFEPRVQEATDKHNLENTKRMDFEEGALKDFFNLRDKEAPAPMEEELEAATAGA